MNDRVLRWIALLSLMLAVLIAGIWIRSYFPPYLAIDSRRGKMMLLFTDHRLVKTMDATSPDFVSPDYRLGVLRGRAGANMHSFAGIEWMQGIVDRAVPTSRFVVVGVPYFYLLPLPLILPAIWLARTLRLRHRAARSLCLTCGYDLRATPERCPECGAVPERAKGAAG